MNNFYTNFQQFCKLRHVQVDIKEVRYLEMREEYVAKNLNWWAETQKCINWLYDHDKKTINANRLRNWATNALKYQKEIELKKRQEYADRSAPKPKPKVKQMEKLWIPY